MNNRPYSVKGDEYAEVTIRRVYGVNDGGELRKRRWGVNNKFPSPKDLVAMIARGV